MPAGRPTEYSNSVLIKSEEYLESCVDEPYERVKTEGEKSTSWDNLLRVKLPSIEGLSVYLGIARVTVYDWKEKYPEFSYIVEKVLAEQAKRLLENGLSGTYNASIAKVLLSKHGYVERTELTGKDGKDFIPDQVAKEKADEAISSFLNDNTRDIKK